ncbi:MAG TPA: long-chain fatty acid--CoA ligase [Desulfobacteraceae bacterium]|nr:long-chain fatty acid--CoA ligase [Desulfobacteraceae bacterium]
MKKTLPDLLVENCRKWGKSRIALREKEYGIWREITWLEYLDNVKAVALGLVDLGLRKGDIVTIISTNRPEWIYAELAAQSVGAISLGLYSEMENLEQLKAMLVSSDTRFLFVEDQEQVDKILAIKDAIKSLHKIIVDEFHEVDDYTDPALVSYAEVMSKGSQIDRDNKNLFFTYLDKVEPSDVALLTTTSGSTALPKLAMLTHEGFLYMPEALDEVDYTDEDFEFVSFLPPAWAGERMMSLAWALYKGFIVNFPEKSETLNRDMREIGPYVLFAPPRTWENMLAQVKVKMRDATFLKRVLFDKILSISEKIAERSLKKKPLSRVQRMLSVIAQILIFRKIKDHLGLTRAKIAFTGGAALGEDTFRFFHALGIKIRQVYGQSEIGGIAVLHSPDDIRLDTVGKALPGTEIRIAPNGEILLKSKAVCKGYYKEDEKTKETIKDGWLYTSDQGYMDEGHLVMIDRMGHVLELRSGTKFSPQYLENKLKFSPNIREAIVFGDKRDYVAALVQIDFYVVGKWAENAKIPYSTFKDLASKEEVYGLIENEIKKINRSIPDMARIRRFELLKKELDPEDDEITQTQKIRRKAIKQKYASMVEDLYNEVVGSSVLKE